MTQLRREGFVVAVVERWLPLEKDWSRKYRKDLFGFADLIAFSPTTGEVLLVQATSKTNVSARLKKSRALPELAWWLRSGNRRFEVHGWTDEGDLRRIEVRRGDLEAVPLPSRKRPKKALANQRCIPGLG